MPQARRIKSKPTKSKKRKASKRSLPWGLLLVVLITGVILGKLLHGARYDGEGFGAGLKNLLDQPRDAQDEDTQAIQELVSKSTEKEFEFYEVLPEIEQVLPDDLPEASPTPEREERDYFVQAASFRKHADAEKMRARLALKGFKSFTQSRTSEERGTFYRVVLGPFEDKRKAKNTKNQLTSLGVNPIVTSVSRQK